MRRARRHDGGPDESDRRGGPGRTVRAAALLFAAATPAASAAVRTWQVDDDGSFGDAQNWNGAVPAARDTAVFRRGDRVRYTVTIAKNLPARFVTDGLRIGSNAVTFASGDPPLTYEVASFAATRAGRAVVVGENDFDGAFLTTLLPVTAETVAIGEAAGASGTLYVAAASWDVTASPVTDWALVVGDHGAGTLDVSGGAALRVTGAQSLVAVGARGAAAGTVNVTGPGSRWTSGRQLSLGFGSSATASLNLTAGGAATSFAVQVALNGSTATANVGPGSVWTVQDNLFVGRNGTVRITGGGRVDSTSPIQVEGKGLIQDGGVVSIDGAGSAWTVNSGVSVQGGGALRVTNGGRFQSNATTVYAGGSVVVDGAGSTAAHGGPLTLNGTMEARAGGRVDSGVARMGTQATPLVAAVLVTGAGSTWTVNGALHLSTNDGAAALTIAGGGAVTVTGGIADGGSRSGTITLDGGTLDLRGQPLRADVLNVRGGTLANLADVNNGAGLTKTTAGTLTLEGTTAYPGPTVVAGGTLAFTTTYTNGARVDVADGATARIATSAATPRGVVLRTGAVDTHAAGRLDVRDNKLIVTGQSVAAVAALVQSGFNGGAWDGPGIVTTAGGGNTTLGVVRAADAGLAGGAFGGVPVAASDVLVIYTRFGDATLDGVVNFNDLVRLAQNYNTTVSATTESWWAGGDFTYDGVVDFNDLVKLAQNYNTALPGAPVPGAPAGFGGDLAAAFATVPEPGMLGRWAAVVTGLITRRRGRRPHKPRGR